MDIDREIITESAEETAKEGKELAGNIRAGDTLCLYGELGSGKTTFVQGFAKGLGITTRLLSPTFIIVRRYDIPASEKFLYHIDLYRLTKMEDFDELGLDEIFANPRSFVVVEWAEKLEGMLPNDRIDIRFETLTDGTHKIYLDYGRKKRNKLG
jgi:tRNA threonylcarbamoyladenosine biosynthesis protein TsaE